jgi:transcription-repair coupling factor (superfamily II helicase)
LFLGQAVEIYPAGALGPVRVELTEGEISAIRFYEISSQRAIADADDLTLDPVSELPQGRANIAQQTTESRRNARFSLFDYLPAAIVVADAGIERRADTWFQPPGRGH